MSSAFIELPRNPLDERIDCLSPEAIEHLSAFSGVSMVYCPLPPPAVTELIEKGFLEYSNHGKPHPSHQWPVAITFDGNNAQQRINCGIYHHHKRIEERRRARDSAMESIPGFASF